MTEQQAKRPRQRPDDPRRLTPPRYGERALSDVLPSALAALSEAGDDAANPLGLPPAASYVVLLVDGMGWNLLAEHADEAPYLARLMTGERPATCGVPSTTATSITSLGTGLPTGAHGVVGYTCRLPGTSQVFDSLRWEPWVDPREWQPHPTVFEYAAAAGRPAFAVSRRMFAGSGLTEASQRGATYVGADSPGERISATARAANERGSLTYVYESELDATGHRAGCRSWAWRHQLGIVDGLAERLREALPPDTALVVTADHGMVDVPVADRIDVSDEPALLDGVAVFAGEARFRHLYCTAGAVDDVRDAWQERCGDRAVVVTRDEAIERGWFGAVDPAVRPRLGDVMVAGLGDIAVVSSQQFPYEAELVGLHGSLSADEMLIPILVDPGRLV